MSSEGIFANLAFCIPFGLLMLILFIYFRQHLPLFYHRNILCNGRSVLGMKFEKEFSGWVRSILNLKDTELLNLGGLDTLVVISTFRLIAIFVFIMVIPCLLILVPFYYANSDVSVKLVDFETFTIADLRISSFLWPPLIILAFMTFIVLYGIYSFYSNFIKLRQAFLLRPSSLSSIGSFLNKVEAFGSIKAAHRREDLPSVTVLLHPIPADLTDSDTIKEILESSGVQGIESVQLIGNYDEVAKLMKKRNSSLYKLENALKTVHDELYKKLPKNEQNSIEPQEFTIKEQTDLLNQLIGDTNVCASVRPRHKTRKPAEINPETADKNGTVDSIRHFYAKLVERDEKVHQALKKFNDSSQAEILNDDQDDRKNLSRLSDSGYSNSLDFEKRYIEETTFISWSKVKNFSENLAHLVNLDSNQCALLHFSDYREAARAQQIMLSSRLNAMESSIAPGPDDLNWKFVKWSQRQRWRGAIISNLRYWMLVILFAPIVAAIVSFIDLSSLGKWIPEIEKFRSKNPNIRAVLEGVLAPLCATLVLKRTGVWIKSIMLLRGPMNQTELALKVQSAHFFFLFIQLIFFGAIFSNSYQFVTEAIANNFKFGVFITVLCENIPKKAHFFFNFMIQDIFNEMMLELLNPKSLFFDRNYLNKGWRKEKTTRKLFLHDTNPPELEIAIVWSRFIMFPLLVFMVYVIICPLIVIPTLLYFSYAYFVFRFRFSQYGRNFTETGGKYWNQCSRQILYALILGQLSVFLQYTQFRKGILPMCLIICLLSITIVFIPLLKHCFGKISENLSVLENDVQKSKYFAISMLEFKNKIINDAVKCLENSQLVNSKLEREITDHLNFSDIDPLATIQKDFNSFESKGVTKYSLIDHYWSIVPLDMISNYSIESNTGTFDPFQIDRLIDDQYMAKQYRHPLIMKHSQVLIVSKDLPKLLKMNKD